MRSSLLWQKDSNPKSANDARLLQIATSKNPHGLPWGVVSKHCRWDGSTGYRLSNDKRGVLSRDYDVTQSDPKSCHKKKVMTWIESSHDVPTGSPAAAIALTKRETNYIQMLLGMRDFDKIDEFVDRYAAL